MTLRIGSLFSGIGGLELGIEMAVPGARVVWQAESDPHARAVLEHHYPTVKRYNDVREIDGQAERPDIICGGFPCQDISLAGAGAGIDGPKSGLWAEYARIVRDLRPDFVFVENVAALLGRGLDRVLGDLAALGYDAEWETFLASDVGAPHRRDRLFLLAYSDRERVRQLAERDQWGGRGERAAERGDAELVHDRAQLADTHGEAGRPEARESVSRDGPEALGPREEEPGRLGGGALPDPQRPGREGMRSGEPSGARRTDVAELRAGPLGNADSELRDGRERDARRGSGGGIAVDGTGEGGGSVADPVRGGQRPSERDLRTGKPDVDRGGERELLADADSAGRSLVRGGELLDRERPAPGDDADRRHRPHRFPPGPAAIARWDGPQPAIRRGDDGVPGRSHRLRLLGNAVVPQCAALAFRTLIARAADLPT